MKKYALLLFLFLPLVFAQQQPTITSPKTGFNFYGYSEVNISWVPNTPESCVFEITIKNNTGEDIIFTVETTNASDFLWQPSNNISPGWYVLNGRFICGGTSYPSDSIKLRKIATLLPKKNASANFTYLESFVSAPFSSVFGNTEIGKSITAILIIGFFLAFVSLQNIRIEAKAVVIVPALLLASAYIGWLLSLVALGVGIIFYIALSRLFNK